MGAIIFKQVRPVSICLLFPPRYTNTHAHGNNNTIKTSKVSIHKKKKILWKKKYFGTLFFLFSR